MSGSPDSAVTRRAFVVGAAAAAGSAALAGPARRRRVRRRLRLERRRLALRGRHRRGPGLQGRQDQRRPDLAGLQGHRVPGLRRQELAHRVRPRQLHRRHQAVRCDDPGLRRPRHAPALLRGPQRQNNVYLWTHKADSSVSATRYILRVKAGMFLNDQPDSYTYAPTTVEAADVFRKADGQTRSKHYARLRAIDYDYTGWSTGGVGLWIVRSNHEKEPPAAPSTARCCATRAPTAAGCTRSCTTARTRPRPSGTASRARTSSRSRTAGRPRPPCTTAC